MEDDVGWNFCGRDLSQSNVSSAEMEGRWITCAKDMSSQSPFREVGFILSLVLMEGV
jgi:hypothetical protein